LPSGNVKLNCSGINTVLSRFFRQKIAIVSFWTSPCRVFRAAAAEAQSTHPRTFGTEQRHGGAHRNRVPRQDDRWPWLIIPIASAPVAEALHGKVLGRSVVEYVEVIEDTPYDRSTEIMHVEIPADMTGADANMFGMSGFTAVIIGQDTRLAPRRIIDMDSRTIVCDELTTIAFYTFRVELTPHAARVETQPHVAAIAITRPTKPFGT
jgi:hypothetical protein